MLNLIPFACPWRKMTNCYCYSNFVRQILQKYFPASVSASVASSTISTDEQVFALCIMFFSNYIPPLSDAFNGELCSIVAHAYVDQSIISFEIINAIRNRSAN